MRLLAQFVVLTGMGLGIVSASSAQAQCYGYRPRPYVAPTYVYREYPYVDNSFYVTYQINFPAPALAGSTIYGNTQPYGFNSSYGFSQLDPLELYKVKVNAGQRGLELGAQIVQSADVTIAQVG